MKSWPDLPDHIRMAIMALIKNAGQAPRGGGDA